MKISFPGVHQQASRQPPHKAHKAMRSSGGAKTEGKNSSKVDDRGYNRKYSVIRKCGPRRSKCHGPLKQKQDLMNGLCLQCKRLSQKEEEAKERRASVAGEPKTQKGGSGERLWYRYGVIEEEIRDPRQRRSCQKMYS